VNPIFISPVLDPLTQLENRRIIKEKNVSVFQIGNIFIPPYTNLKGCCAQFYYPKLDHKIEVGDRVLRVSYSWKNAHLLCWNYSKDLYGKLGWRYARYNDTNYNIKIDGNTIHAITSKGKVEEKVEPLDLQ
jgi:hypothetical protein